MEIIKQGAEAILYIGSWEGQKVLVKERIKKRYRIDQIDSKLRKERTAKEVKLLREARSNGVPTPQIFNVDNNDYKIIMEFIDGEQVKKFFGHASIDDVKEISEKIGISVARLHEAGIVHGDLTTSNMILKDGIVYFIDFGLGQHTKRVEDKGMDLRLLQNAIKSAHYEILEEVWSSFMKGYKKEYKNAQTVIKKTDEISRRARYAER